MHPLTIYVSMRHHLLSAILLCLACTSSLSAQQPAGGALQCSFVTWENLSIPALLYKDGDNYHEIKMMKRQRSQLYEMKRGQAEMQLFREVVNDEGETVYAVVAKSPIKPGSSSMLFFIQERSEKKEGELPLLLSGIDDSLEAFPMGSFRFVNNTKTPVQVLFPSSKDVVQARSAKVLVPKIPQLGGFIPLYILDMNKNVLFQSRFFGQPRGRKMVFVNPPKGPESKVHVAFLPHIVPLPPPDEGE